MHYGELKFTGPTYIGPPTLFVKWEYGMMVDKSNNKTCHIEVDEFRYVMLNVFSVFTRKN